MVPYSDYISNRFSWQDVHVVASGPSLIGFDYSRFNGCNVIAVNHVHKLIDFNQAHGFVVFNDNQFLVEDPDFLQLGCPVVCAEQVIIPDERVDAKFKFADRFGFDSESGVFGRSSSGIAALSIALQSGAGRIFLWGFDYRFLNKLELLKAARMNNASDGIFEQILDGGDYQGHSTSGVFKHSMDSINDEFCFIQTTKYFSEFIDYHNIVNMSPFSAIPDSYIGRGAE